MAAELATLAMGLANASGAAVVAAATVVPAGGLAFDGDWARLTTLLVGSVLTNNIALTYFIGMCAFLALSKNMRVAFGMGISVTFVTGLTSVVNWLINYFFLVPLRLEFLQFLVFIIIIAAIVQFLELFLDRFFPSLYEAFGIYLPLITVNCTVLAASLFMVLRNYGFWQNAVFSFGTGAGWLLAILLLAGVRHHLPFARPAKNLGEIGTALLLAGILAMAFSGFSGMITL